MPRKTSTKKSEGKHGKHGNQPETPASDWPVGTKKLGEDKRFWKVVLTTRKNLVWERCGEDGVSCAPGDITSVASPQPKKSSSKKESTKKQSSNAKVSASKKESTKKQSPSTKASPSKKQKPKKTSTKKKSNKSKSHKTVNFDADEEKTASKKGKGLPHYKVSHDEHAPVFLKNHDKVLTDKEALKLTYKTCVEHLHIDKIKELANLWGIKGVKGASLKRELCRKLNMKLDQEGKARNKLYQNLDDTDLQDLFNNEDESFEDKFEDSKSWEDESPTNQENDDLEEKYSEF